jgi:hypothetical protein
VLRCGEWRGRTSIEMWRVVRWGEAGDRVRDVESGWLGRG